MKKILFILIFSIFLTNLNATDLFESISNSPNISQSEIKQKIDMSKVTKYKNNHNIPFRANPNLSTLQYYFHRDLFRHMPSKLDRYFVEPSETPYEFEFETIDAKSVKKELKTKGILSYLYFEDDKVIIDEVSPNDRLGQLFDDETKFRSNSMGKSLPSYILGHAICDGYIESVDATISDWKIVENHLYQNHKLIDLLNMTSGDQKYAYDSHTLKGQEWNNQPWANSNLDTHNVYLSLFNWFRDKEPSEDRYYNYNVLNTQLIFNYILFKTGDENFQKLLNKVFKEKAGIKNIVYFYKLDGLSKAGNAHNMFYATRYDYLRIAKAIMDDYRNETCVGKYLREIYDRRVLKEVNPHGSRGEPHFNRTKYYGGQFHIGYPGLEEKVVFVMGGYGGKAILIDVEDSRIVVVNSIHYNHDRFKYDHKKLLINPIKHGKESFK